jgi:uncharacterized protein DUF2510
MPGLGDLPPPEEGATEGYYPDPLGGKYPRWWDGSQWTNQVGPEPKPPLAPGEDEQVPHRGRTASAVVGAAFRLYRRYPVLFFVLAAGVIVPYDLIALAATGTGQYSRADSGLTALVVLGLLDWVLIAPLVSALHVHAVADVRDGHDPELRSVAVRGLGVLPVVAAATIMSGLGIALGLVALIVPGVILYFRWFVVSQVAAMEDGGWLEALHGSRRLTRDNYGHIFVFILLLALITAIPDGILPLAFSRHDTTAASFVVGLVAHLFTVSVTALCTALLYFDLVARRQTSS